MQSFDVIVLGAGAAGMLAAIEAGRRGRRVLIVEGNSAAGEKIRISGGGRCNFTNRSTHVDRFLSQNPRFAISALKRFGPSEFLARLALADIAWEERLHGQLFCQGSARQIVDLLLRDLHQVSVELWLGSPVGAVRRQGDGFEVETPRGGVRAARLIVATGGRSIPKMGATGLGYQIAGAFGLPIIETRPALVPLTFGEADLAWMSPLAGVGLPGVVRLGRAGFEEAVLFTHRGLSGPAILQISSYWRERQSIQANFAPGVDVAAFLDAEKRANGRQLLRTALGKVLPERLARQVEQEAGETRPLAEVPAARLRAVAGLVAERVLVPIGTEGYRTAEVTLGGVDTAALDGRTMEARGVPGLYFVGEVVDVTGWLGGYNFQWAWSSGWVAGQAV
jgi:predicted Rossmann fold flavoprotein